MAKQVIKGKNFDANLISISDKPSVMESGAKYVWVGYKSKNLIVQTPNMEIPFGLNIYDKGEYPKYSVELSFRGMEEDKAMKAFHDNLQNFDEKLVDEGVNHSMAWFKKKTAKRDVISAMFNRQVRVPMDKETGEELTQYPNRLRLKIPVKNNSHECDLYDMKGNKLEGDLKDIFTRGATVTAIIQCVGLWISAGSYNCQWKLVKANVDVPDGGGEIDFLPDTDDEEESPSTNEETVDSKAAVANVEANDEDDDEDDDDEDDDDDDEDDDDEDDDEEERDPTPPPEPVKKTKKSGGRKSTKKN